jgi:uncharacterized protein with FMN-binding domain
MEPSKPPTKALIGLVAVVLLVIAATVVVMNTGNNSQATTSSTISPAAKVAASPAATSFKDGTYSATGSYDSPGGTETIDVTVTLANNVITSVAATPRANVQEAAEYQQAFISGYQPLVVGKKITDVSLTRVAGSSLTSIGFNDAISQIESKAAA